MKLYKKTIIQIKTSASLRPTPSFCVMIVKNIVNVKRKITGKMFQGSAFCKFYRFGKVFE